MPEWLFLNLDGGILLWLQEAVRNAVPDTHCLRLHPSVVTAGLHVGLPCPSFCSAFKKTGRREQLVLMALLLS